jgi:predicted DNA-binding transcriptional regulator AlpA
MEAARTRFNVSEAASLLRVSKSWLDKKRLDGGGPEFHKFGRRVVYDQRDLDSWAARNKRRHTSEVLTHKS